MNIKSLKPKKPLTYLEFLQTTKTLRMLYGISIAKAYFDKNLDNYYIVEYHKANA